MSGTRSLSRAEDRSRSWPVWRLVLRQELVELWAGGKALGGLVLFAVLMSITAYLLATNYEISLAPLKQTVVVALTAAVTFGLFFGLVVAAESISGERERATLEPLLLTPTSHRQIVLGKLLNALSPWPAAFAVSVPYIVTLARGESVVWPALFWGALIGTVLAVGFAAFGMLVSIWSDSSRMSLFVCLLVYAVSLVPSQLPTEFQVSRLGTLIAAVDPVEAAAQVVDRAVQYSEPFSQVWPFVLAPVVFTALVVWVLFALGAPRLALQAGRIEPPWRGKASTEPMGSREGALT